VYVVEDRFQKKFTRDVKDKRYHQLLLAKNAVGYRNLMQIVSLGFLDGLYNDFPRVDRALIEQHSEGIIATSCCIGAEVPQAIIHRGEEEAEKILLDWRKIFGDDYYVELQRHHIEDIDNTGWSQEAVNQVLIKLAKKNGIKIIATNDSHYVNLADARAHDILLCLQTGKNISDPDRFKFANDQFFFKTQEEMKELFKDVPDAIENTLEIAEKVQHLSLEREVLLPAYTIPESFATQDDYLKYLTYEGARKRWGELIPTGIKERLDFELSVIKDMKFPGYFLIVQDFIGEAKRMGVAVGPGRGSASGSAVAYAIGITNVDPIKYNLLFERFLNPERVSMPDMDIDFDDVGRQKVIDYVVQKYGHNQVAQIITYGTMAAKSAIRDVGRVLKLPLSETDKMAKLVPEVPKITLKTAYHDVPELREIREMDTSLRGETLQLAEELEGSIRNRGIHAAGVIIAPGDIKNFVPVCKAKDSELLVTQFDGKYIESAGMLKMDFLGLKTLTILNFAIQLIEKNYGINIDLDNIPLDDVKTFELYQKGETIGTFQFESEGMQKHLKDLKPDCFEDLIAMNALYRPGPMEYIPNYIKRKHGTEAVHYDLAEMDEFLKDTYGITVYQEQVMLLSQKLGGFSKARADDLRKAMGKKDRVKLDSLKPQFMEGAKERGLDLQILEKVWTDWEAFASYAFNKSHSTCYAYVAFQTAYLKAHYPAEFMAAVLSHNMNNVKDIYFFMNECRRMNIAILGPDINESDVKFSVNKKGEIRYALSAIKGVGESAVTAIIEERDAHGNFEDVYDLVKRVSLRAVNKKNIEMLAQAGAFDSFTHIHRAQYFVELKDGGNYVDRLIRFGNQYKQQKEANVSSLFGGSSDDMIIPPDVPHSNKYDDFTRLQKEKEVMGIYLTGHPLDDFSNTIDLYAQATLNNIMEYKNRNSITVAALITDVQKKLDAKGKYFAVVKIEDKEEDMELRFFGEDYNKFMSYFEIGNRLMFQGFLRPFYSDNERYEFKISNIQYLQDVLELKSKGIVLAVPYLYINVEFIDILFKTLKKFKGKKPFHLYVIDDNNDKLQFHSKSYMVEITESLILNLSKFLPCKVKIL
jgi:DNA polymerase-3 subunit alpha